MKKTVFFLLLGAMTLFSCSNDDDAMDTQSCDASVFIDSQQYENGESDSFSFNSVELIGDCLNLRYSATGCDGNSWVVRLVAHEAVSESLPPMMDVRLLLVNQEACTAEVSQEQSFDLSNLQGSGSSITIQLEDWESTILYEY
ncbi:hypothetical protein [Candidatus Ulvibacter alkanivorans]|uniref:hypothetical protein n=1 Tax=Candidatus Ulvibacter alkanivorans TaxID=2267620 RepID=UPI000DF484B7|nr:hypothetical protein [Candidatus Ulvibacter alkanivorans]